MKKFALFTLVLILTALLCVPAFAAAELTVTETTLFIYDDDDDGYFFAKVENTGDAGAYFRSGTLELRDDTGNAFITKNYVSSAPYGIYLEPGESAYVRESIWDKLLLETKVDGFTFSVTTDTWGTKYHKLPCEAEFYYSTDSTYDNEMFITLTNDTQDLMHDLSFVAALYDENDTLLYVYSTSYGNLAVHPDSTITIMLDVNSALAKHLNTYGYTPVRIEGFVYAEED